MTASRSVARGALTMLSTQPFTWSASLVTALVVPRLLGDQRFGQLAVAVSLTGLLQTIALLGIPEYLARAAARRPARAAEEAVGASALVTGLAIVAAALLAALLPALGAPLPVEVLQAALIVMIVNSTATVVKALFRGQERHALFAWTNAAGVVLAAAAGIGALAAGWGVAGMFVAQGATYGSILIFSWFHAGLRVSRAALDPALLRRVALGGLPFLGWGVALHVRGQIDLVLVGLLLHDQAAGWLAAAYRIIGIPIFIPTLITTPLLPALSRYAGEWTGFRAALRHSLIGVLLLTVPCAAAIFALAPVIPGVLGWGTQFGRSVPLMMILSCQQPFMAADMVLGTALIAIGRERKWLRVAVVAAVFNPAANLLLLPAFERVFANGALAAALVEVATEILMFGGALALMPRGLLDRSLLVVAARVVAAGASLAVAMRLLLPLSLPLAVAGGGVAYGVAVLAFGVLRPADCWARRNIIREWLSQRGTTKRALGTA